MQFRLQSHFALLDVSSVKLVCDVEIYICAAVSKEGCLRLWILLIAEGDHEGGSTDLGAGKRAVFSCVRINFYFHQTFPDQPDGSSSTHWSQNLNWLDLDFFWHLAQLCRLISVFTFVLWQNSWFRVLQLFNISTSETINSGQQVNQFIEASNYVTRGSASN